ncbi:MAG: hypothetical protein H8E64_08770 [Candidatus Marinimicrobia bacterium]|nr:hypothetical protein [Candidatus Neomarinimicrobiota bacterium]
MKKTILTSMIISFVFGQVPTMISFQGYITDANGQSVVDGAHVVNFEMYSALTGGTAFWSEEHTLEITGGVLSVNLGSVNPVDLSQSESESVYLEITIDSETLSPRQEITSSMFAITAGSSQISIHAETADNATNAENAETAENATHAENAETAENATHAESADDASTLDGHPASDFLLVDDVPDMQEVPVSFYSYAANPIPLSTSWATIHSLTFTVDTDMALHTHAYYRRSATGSSWIGAQMMLADASGNTIDQGIDSYRAPPAITSYVDSDIVFDVTAGTYTIWLYAVAQTDVSNNAENLYIEVIAIPSTTGRGRIELPLRQDTFHFEKGQPLKIN